MMKWRYKQVAKAGHIVLIEVSVPRPGKDTALLFCLPEPREPKHTTITCLVPYGLSIDSKHPGIAVAVAKASSRRKLLGCQRTNRPRNDLE